jgi:hypothetical protein
MASCPTCGARVGQRARYCPQCGGPLDEGDTRTFELPPDETGPVPVNVTRTEPRFFGVAPASLLLVLAAIAALATIALFATGHWPIALILFGLTILLVLLFMEAARRKPDGPFARTTADALSGFRTRAGVATGALASRGRAATQLLTLRRELQQMSRLRVRLLFELGEAVYGGDEEATETARGRVEELDRLAAQREAEMHAVIERTQERIASRRLEVQPTEVAEQPVEPDEPPPGEVIPPEPARIPEPYPPPDEATPPQPAVIPEPGPAVIPEPGPQGEREG